MLISSQKFKKKGSLNERGVEKTQKGDISNWAHSNEPSET